MRHRKIQQLMCLILSAVLLAACSLDATPADGPVGEAREAVCYVMFGSVPSEGGPPGTSVVWSASTTSDCGLTSPEYEFWVRDPTTETYSVAQAYSASSTYTWTVPSVANGSRYDWQVWIRESGSTASYQMYGGSFFTVDDVSPCTSVSTTPSPSFISGDTTVTFTSSATGCSVAEYEVWVLPPGGSWTDVSSYSANPTWNVNGAAAGTYEVQVWARASGSTAYYEAWTGLAITVSPEPTVSAAVSPAQATDDTQVTISFSSTGLVDPEYEVWVLPPGGSYEVLQAYSTSASCVWNTDGLPAGTYTFQVWARQVGDTDPYDAWTGFTYDLTALYGSFTITNTIDEATLGAYTELTGNLYIDAPGLPIISLPNLKKIDGAIQGRGSGAPDLQQMSLPALTSVGSVLLGNVRNNFPALTTFSAPMLTSIGTFSLGTGTTCPPMTSLDFPSLTSISGQIQIACGSTSTSFPLTAPLLQTAGGLSLSFADAFSITLPELTTSTSLTVSGPASATFSVPALTSVGTGGIVFTDGVSIDAPDLASCAGSLTLDDDQTTLVSLPLLASVGDIDIAPSVTNTVGAALSLPALTTAGTLNMGNPGQSAQFSVWTVDLPALTTLAGITIQGVGPGDLSLPALTSVSPGGITITAGSSPSTNATSALSLPLLATIGGDLSVSGYSPASGALSLPALTSIGGNFTIGTACTGTCSSCASSTTLTSLDFADLASLGATNSGTFTVGYEPTLAQACIQGIALQLQTAGWTGTSAFPPCMLASGSCP